MSSGEDATEREGTASIDDVDESRDEVVEVAEPPHGDSVKMADHQDGEVEAPQSATSTQETSEESIGSHPGDSVLSETQPTEHAEEDQGPLHSQKIATSGLDDIRMSSEDAEPRQHPPVTSTPEILTSPPDLKPINTGLGFTDSPVSPARSDNAESTLASPRTEQADPNNDDRPQAPNRTFSEGISRKMTGTFGWLSRATNIKKNTASPPTKNTQGFPGFTPRRSTQSSVSTIASNHLPPVRDAREGSPLRKESLQDRFQALRMEEENRDSSSDTPTPPAIEQPLKSPMSEHGPENAALSPAGEQLRQRARAHTAVDEKLPPGTASGMAMGPSTEDEGHVNWDLWQQLVYEGPSALAKTSGEQLNAAIQSGIPAPIRGVVWQVLADSKSEGLENVYRNLVGKDDANGLKSPPMSRGDSSSGLNNTNGSTREESLASSASSIRSHSSTPATSTNATSPPPTSTEYTQEDEDKILDRIQVRKRSADQTQQIQKLEKQIRKDLGARTAYSRYIASAGLQEGLFGVCKAYALYDESIGYAQGMNFIAMPLLFNMPEEEAFTLFVKLMSRYDLRSLFTPEMTGLHLRLYQFERLLEDYEPALYCHLHRRGVPPILYATPWFLTLFAYRFPLQLVQRIYDLILTEGLTAIIKFGIVLMRKNAQTLLAMKDMGQLTTHLKEKLFDVYIDKSPNNASILESGFFGLAGGVDKEVYHADALIRDACAIDISAKTLTVYQTEFEEKTRTEKERETELETLRTSNATLVSKLKNVEARVQQQDNDHVGIASELIKTKVENEELSDANESLRTQVQELRKVVENQPAEVEERLKSEMERIMARNTEVQGQNRTLEDAMTEMEQELVGTKMQYAQLNAEYEDIKQKLSGIQQMLGGGAAPAAAVSPK